MSSPRVAIAPAQAILQLAWLLGYERKGHIPLFRDGKPTPIHRLPCSTLLPSCARLARLAHSLDLEESAELAIGVPRVNDFVNSTTVLHAWVSGSEQLKWAAAFRPLPNVVLKIGSGSERLMLWVLRNPLGDDRARDLNERIAYACHAPRTRSRPEQLRLPLPGTFARVGRRKPAPILLTRLHCEKGHDYRTVFAGLKEPPAKDAWRSR